MADAKKKTFRNLKEVLESKKLMALDNSRSVDDWESHQWYAAKAAAFEEALKAVEVFEKEA